MADDELAALERRFVAGIAWLTEHDPTGSFYLWWKSGILPHHPMPAQEDSRRAEYKVYYEAMRLFDVLDQKLLRLQRQAAVAAEGAPA